MNVATLIWRNTWRHRGRALLTIGSIAVSLLLFSALHAVVASMRSVAADSAAQLRLVVHDQTTMTKLLPLRLGREIEQMNGVRAVCGVRWFGGRLDDSAEQFPSLAADPHAFPVVYADFALTNQELDDWESSRDAAVVGVGLAQRRGWSRGDRVTLRSSVPPYLPLDFRIVGITAARAYPNIFALRLDYYNDALRDEPLMPASYDDAVNFYWVKVAPGLTPDVVGRRIDARFAGSPHATKTELEEAFVAQFTQMFGDIPTIARTIGAVVIGAVLLVVLNTMSMSIRERTGEYAVLKAIGYPARTILTLIVGESLLLALLGAAAGGVPLVLLLGGSEAGLSIPYFPVVTVSPAVVLTGLGAAALIGLAAGLGSAWTVVRSPVAAAVRWAG